MKNMATVSRSGIKVVVLFLFFVVLFRTILPVGDEPDWDVRTFELINDEHPFWFPYSLTLANLSIYDLNTRGCIIEASPISYFGSISQQCFGGFAQIAKRSMLTLFVVSPFLLLLIFRRFFWTFLSVIHFMSRNEYNLRLYAIGNCLIFPGSIYYLGLLSAEQFFLTASYAIFLFWGNYLYIGALLLGLFFIDFGNGIVVFVFVLLLIFLQLLIKRIGIKLTFLLSFSMLYLIYFTGNQLLPLLFDSSNTTLAASNLAGKAEAIYESIEVGGYRENYPIILRPIITFLSAVFLTPAGVKSIGAYFIASVGLFTLFYFVRKKLKIANEIEKSKILTFLISPFLLILLFTFLIPNYANAKYYIFTLPFLMYVAVLVFGSQRVLIFNFSLSLTVAFGIGLFWAF